MPYRLNIKLGIGKILDEQTTNSGTKRKTVPVNLNDFFLMFSILLGRKWTSLLRLSS